MDKKTRATLAGTLGEFWHDSSQIHDANAARPGYAVQDNEFVVLNTIKSRQESYGSGPSVDIPEAVVAATEHSGSVFYDIRRMPSNYVMMASRVSTRRYYARGAVVGFHTDHLRSTDLFEMSIYLPGVTRWSGVAGSKTDNTQDDQGRLKSWSVETQSTPEVRSRLGGGLQIGLSTTWSADMDGPDLISLRTPLAVTVRSTKPVDWYTLFNPIWSCQQLISLAYDGFIVSSGGTAKLDTLEDERPASKPELWSGLLMVKPDGVRLPVGETPLPHFRVGDIGGVQGLMRWIKLSRDHARATGPLTARYSIGSKAAIESQLVDIAVAIEYWVSSHVRTHKWAERARKKEKRARHWHGTVDAPSTSSSVTTSFGRSCSGIAMRL